uniref:Gag-pol polyprotein n=1 Tax=Solanum tuberosum TaxID=4113 RepID=M1DBK6_SOLTU
MLIRDMNIERFMIHVHQVEEDKLKDRAQFCAKSNWVAPSSTSASAPKNKGDFRNQNSQNFRAWLTQSQGSVVQGPYLTPTRAKCGSNYRGACCDGSYGYFKCGQACHFMRECPNNKQDNSNGGI